MNSLATSFPLLCTVYVIFEPPAFTLTFELTEAINTLISIRFEIDLDTGKSKIIPVKGLKHNLLLSVYLSQFHLLEVISTERGLHERLFQG